MITIIGVDCSTEHKKVGLALGEFNGQRVQLIAARTANAKEPPIEIIADWLENTNAALLALDAPLGWPKPLGITLISHQAGQQPRHSPNDMFSRTTDKFVEKRIRGKPMEVGADKIARTAHAALALLDELRVLMGQDIPLAWQPIDSDSAAIEVYPAGTLQALGLPAEGYKGKDQRSVRSQILDGLGTFMDLPLDRNLLLDNADVLDAAICVLAGADFQLGKAMPPSDHTLAKKEGWIWMRPSSS